MLDIVSPLGGDEVWFKVYSAGIQVDTSLRGNITFSTSRDVFWVTWNGQVYSLQGDYVELEGQWFGCF